MLRSYAAVNGLNLYYEIHGAGPGEPLILLHGGLGATEMFGEVLPLLSDVAGRDPVPLLARTAALLSEDAELLAGRVDGLPVQLEPQGARAGGGRAGLGRPELALDDDRPSVSLGDLPRDVEPQAETAEVVHRDGSLEAAEDALQILRTNTDAVVRHGEQPVRTVTPGRHMNLRLAGAVELDGVGQQVLQQLT